MKIFFAILLLVSCVANACDVVDDQGHTIKLAQPATRIISLAPDLTELLFAAGAGSRIVGVVKGSDYPEAAKKIPLVSDFTHADIEKILQLHPDLIVAWGESSLPSQVKKMGVPIYISQQKKLADIPHTLQRLGCLAGTSAIAQSAAENFNQHYKALKKYYATQAKVPVFFQLWATPLMTVSQSSWINEAIDVCGGKNIFADLHGTTAEVSVESVLTDNPQVILATTSQPQWKTAWYAWPQIAAVKNNRLYAVDPDLVERAGPRTMDGVEQVCRAIASARMIRTTRYCGEKHTTC